MTEIPKIEHDTEELIFHGDNPRVKEAFDKLFNEINTPALTLHSLMMFHDKNDKIKIRCKHCLLRVAIMYRDLGALCEEIAELK